jgi:hypothetical protein
MPLPDIIPIEPEGESPGTRRRATLPDIIPVEGANVSRNVSRETPGASPGILGTAKEFLREKASEVLTSMGSAGPIPAIAGAVARRMFGLPEMKSPSSGFSEIAGAAINPQAERAGQAGPGESVLDTELRAPPAPPSRTSLTPEAKKTLADIKATPYVPRPGATVAGEQVRAPGAEVMATRGPLTTPGVVMNAAQQALKSSPEMRSIVSGIGDIYSQAEGVDRIAADALGWQSASDYFAQSRIERDAAQRNVPMPTGVRGFLNEAIRNVVANAPTYWMGMYGMRGAKTAADIERLSESFAVAQAPTIAMAVGQVGSSYNDPQRAHMSPGDRLVASIVDGYWEWAGEQLGFAPTIRAMKQAGMGGLQLTNGIKAAMADGMGEAMTQLGQIENELRNRLRDTPTATEALKEAAHAAAMGVIVSGAMQGSSRARAALRDRATYGSTPPVNLTEFRMRSAERIARNEEMAAEFERVLNEATPDFTQLSRRPQRASVAPPEAQATVAPTAPDDRGLGALEQRLQGLQGEAEQLTSELRGRSKLPAVMGVFDVDEDLSWGPDATPEFVVERAQIIKPHHDKIVDLIANDIGAGVLRGPIKTAQKIGYKIKTDYGGDASQVKDAVRSTGVIALPEGVQAGLDRAGEVAKLGKKIRNLWVPGAPSLGGYRDGLVNVIIGGAPTELQFNLPEMIKAKEEAHPIKDAIDALEKEFKNRKPTAQEVALLDSYKEAMMQIFMNAEVEVRQRIERGRVWQPGDLTEIGKAYHSEGMALADRTRALVSDESPNRLAKVLSSRRSSPEGGQGILFMRSPESTYRKTQGSETTTGLPSTSQSSPGSRNGSMEQSVRRQGETDKEFAKRVIDTGPVPSSMAEEYGNYFDLRGEYLVVPLDQLVSSKTSEETRDSGVNAARRMLAADRGQLSKREPITVRREGDKFRVVDGNSTVAAARQYGWKALPVRVESGLPAVLGVSDADRAGITGHTTDLTGGVSPIRVPERGKRGSIERLGRKIARQGKTLDAAAPRNERRLITAPDGKRLVVGRRTAADWAQDVDVRATPEDIALWRRWYQEVYPMIGEQFSQEMAPQVTLAWLLSQQAASPTKGMTDVLRVMDRLAGRPTYRDGKILEGGLADHKIEMALRGQSPQRGYDQKLLDFVDSAMGLTTRTVMGRDVRGGSPGVVDVWTSRDVGFVDKKFINRLRAAKVDVTGLENDVKSGSPSETQYEWGSERLQEITDYLNQINWHGGNWTPAQVQAVGWMNLQRALNATGQSVQDVFDTNTRRVSVGLEPGPGSGGRTMTAAEVRTIAHNIMQQLGTGHIRSVIETGGAFERVAEGSVQFDVFASPETIDDFMAMLGYALRQQMVIATRPLESGKQFYSDVTAKSGLETTEQAQRFYEAVLDEAEALVAAARTKPEKRRAARVLGTVAGYQQVVHDNGNRGVRFISIFDPVSPLMQDEVINVIERAGSKIGLSDVSIDNRNAEVRNVENHWDQTSGAEGSGYLGNLRSRGRLQQARWLQSQYGADQGQGRQGDNALRATRDSIAPQVEAKALPVGSVNLTVLGTAEPTDAPAWFNPGDAERLVGARGVYNVGNNPDVRAAIGTSINDMIAAGVPEQLLASVDMWATFDFSLSNAKAAMAPDDGKHVLMLSESLVNQFTFFASARQGGGSKIAGKIAGNSADAHKAVRGKIAGYMIHELTHHIDVINRGQSISGDSPRLEYEFDEINGGFKPTGDLIQEVMDATNEHQGIAVFFHYPFGMIDARDYRLMKSEILAQMGTLYFSDNRMMKKYMPKAYEVMRSVYGSPTVKTAQTPANALIEARIALQAALQQAGASIGSQGNLFRLSEQSEDRVSDRRGTQERDYGPGLGPRVRDSGSDTAGAENDNAAVGRDVVGDEVLSVQDPNKNPLNGKPIGLLYAPLKKGEIPTRTRIVYKLMRLMPTRPGVAFPLYARPMIDGRRVRQGFLANTWSRAENQIPTLGPKDLAERPGLHAIGLPIFDQGKARVDGELRVWVKVEMPVVTAKTQRESDNSRRLPNGMRSGITNRLLDPGESYNYKTNPSASDAGGGWPISGSMRIVQVLSDAEVSKILRDAGKGAYISNSMTGVNAAQAAKINADMRAVAKAASPASKLPTILGAQTDLTDTPAFKKAFGESKIVDRQGNPLVMYHGTARDFDVFNMKRGGDIWGTSDSRGVMWFSSNPNRANEAAEDAAVVRNDRPDDYSGANVMPVYLRVTNPYYADESETEDPAVLGRVIARAKRAGHDGVVMPGEFGGKDVAVFRREQIKSAIGNSGAYDLSLPSILEAQAPPPRSTQIQANLPPIVPPSNVAGQNWNPNNQPFLVEQPGKWDNFVRAFQDKLVDTKRVEAAITEMIGRPIDEDKRVYLHDETYYGRVSDRTNRAWDNMFRPLLKHMADEGVSVAQADEYLYARHAKERNAQMRRVNPGVPNNDALSGMSDADADSILNAIRSGPKAAIFAEIGRRVDDITRATRRIIVSDGLETQGTISAWEGAYKSYVPLFRDEDSPGLSQGFSVRGPESRRATGSTRAASHILANVFAQHENVIHRAERNRVAQAMFRLAREYDNPSFWEVNKVPMKKHIDPRTGFAVLGVDPFYKNSPNVIVAKFQGVEQTIVFNEHNDRALMMARNLKNLDAAQLKWGMDYAARVTRFFANMATQWNPVFWATNFTRDYWTAMGNLSDTEINNHRWRVTKNIGPAIAGMYRSLRGYGPSPWTQWAEEYRREGGMTGYAQLFDGIVDREREIAREVKALSRSAVNPIRLARAFMDWISAVNSAVENGVRLAAYVEAKRSGLTPMRAASVAKNLTVNFNRKGNATGIINTLWMFTNANIQGNSRMFQAVAKSRALQAGVAAAVLLGFLADMLARAVAGDDEDGNNQYDIISDGIKERNMIFMTGGPDGGHFKIPLPYGYHIFPNLGRLISASIWDTRPNRTVMDAAGSMLKTMFEAFVPLGSGSPAQVASFTITDPFVQWIENKQWNGAPLYPEQDRFSPKIPEYQLIQARDSEFAKRAAKWANSVTGGDDVVPGRVNVPPAFFDHVIKSLTLGLGTTVSQALDVGAKAAFGEEMNVNTIPLLNRFYGEVDDVTRSREFWRRYKDVKDTLDQVKRYQESGRDDKAEALIEKKGSLIDLARNYKASRGELSALRKERKELENDEDISYRDKREASRDIERRRTEILRRVMRESQ